MTAQERNALIDGFEKAYGKLRALVAGMSAEALAFVPNLPDAWSANDHLVHLLDAEANLNLRVRGAVAEPGIAAPAWEPEAWKARDAYGKSDGRACLELAASLRQFVAASLRVISAADFDAAYILHSVRGKMELPALLKMYADHPDWHETYIRRNLTAFAAAGKA